ncbi:hypothetical protein SSP24_29210 [Streptomyces spinoverrucosus]|uniref:Uncharacterized protein n=1 Tax=Streptomyces spinoverrucosus TaxID=284043 RepID=A0A4Y3VJR0_9ACTN|nr:hypothetical protein SSP24_29210 [Streptomyces spinoverrucosus]GHB73063.1 hypothetical protein GCM10010397_49380 [Streptomyces spinoverrucosus]
MDTGLPTSTPEGATDPIDADLRNQVGAQGDWSASEGDGEWPPPLTRPRAKRHWLRRGFWSPPPFETEMGFQAFPRTPSEGVGLRLAGRRVRTVMSSMTAARPSRCDDGGVGSTTRPWSPNCGRPVAHSIVAVRLRPAR